MSEQILYGGSTSQLATGSTEYIGIIGGATLQSSVSRAIIPWAAAGTITDFYVWLSAAPGAGKSRTFDILGGAGSVSVTISNTDTEGSDTGSTATIAGGNQLYLRSTVSSAPAAAYMRYSYKWTPTTAGEHIVGGLTESTQLSTSGAQSLSAGGAAPAPYSTETPAWIYVPVPCDCEDFYYYLTTAPGVGNKDRRFNIRKNGANQGATSCLIAEGATTGNNTGNTVSYAAGDYFSIRSSLADFGSPAPNASYVGFSFVCKCTDTDYFFIVNNGSSYLPFGTNTDYRQAQTGGNAWNSSLTGRRFQTQEMFIDRAYFKTDNAPSSGSWSTSLYNINWEPSASWSSGSSTGQLVVVPKREVADRAFAAVVSANSIPASPPDNSTVLSACYACKTVLPTRYPPFMF
jgi:hypothetical protein